MTGTTHISGLGVEFADDLCADLVATSGRSATVVAPFTGATLHELPLSSASDVTDAAAAARAAQRAWSAASFAHRRAVLLKGHDLLLERQDAVLDILQTETGKTRGQAFEEVFLGASVARYYAVKARGILSAETTTCRDPGGAADSSSVLAKGPRRGHHAVELPHRAVARRRSARARGRQRCCAKGRQSERALDPRVTEGVHRCRRTRGPLGGRHRPRRRDRQCGRGCRELRVFHGLHTHRREGGRARRSSPTRCLPRARRQERAHRAR